MALRLLPPRPPRLLACGLAAAFVLSACGSAPPKARLEEQQQQRDFAARGYPPLAATPSGSRGAALVPQPLHWRLKGEDVRWNLLTGPAPATTAATAPGAPRPVLLYLPGLGENESAGLAWRQAWAGAGYAVLSLQPLEDDAQAWASDLARAGEFHALGQRHYAPAQLQRRVQRLNELLAEARRRGAQGEAPWQGLDWNRLALAGFETGAQTVQALAGEPLADGTVLRLDGGLAPRAVVLISPHVVANAAGTAAAGPGSHARFQGIRTPVLVVSGPRDEDLLGLVEQPDWRAQAFQQLPSPQRRLLWLDGVNHRALAGQGGVAVPDREEASRQGGTGRRGGGMGGGEFRQNGSGGPGGQRIMAPVPNGPDWRGLHERQLGLTAAQQVSRAFLDAHLGDSASAQRWLDEQAPDWLRGVGQIRR